MRYLIRNNSLQKLDKKVTPQRLVEWTSEMKALLTQQVNGIRKIESKK